MKIKDLPKILRASKIGQWRIKQSDLDVFLDKSSNVSKK